MEKMICLSNAELEKKLMAEAFLILLVIHGVQFTILEEILEEVLSEA